MTDTPDTPVNAAEDEVARLLAEFEQVGSDLDELTAGLPAHVQEHPEPHSNGIGMDFEPHRGWTDAELEQVHQLRARQRELALELAQARRRRQALTQEQ